MNAETPVHTPARKHVILFLAANPVDLRKVALDREARDIQVELERSGHRDCFEFVTRWAAEPSDLLRELRKLKPTVVHFSGHGTAVLSEGRAVNVGTRDVIEPCARGDPADSGLCFQGPDGRAQIVRAEALAEAFGSVRSHVKLVVLNACYSDAQATALLSHVDCVIGMRGAIQDDAARSFAIGFYGGLGERESVGAAYLQGRASISLGDLADSDRPKLRTRSGVDADQLVLATPSLRRPVRSARSGSAIAFAAIAVALSIAVLAGRAWFAKDLHADAARLVKEGWTRLSGLETESAVMALQQSVALDPGASLSRAALAVAHAEHGDYHLAQVESRNALARASRLGPRDRAWVEGVDAETHWKLPAAVDAYRRAWILTLFRDRDAGLRLARVLALSGDERAALLMLDWLPQPSSEDDVRADYLRAMAARGAGSFPNQLDLLERIAKRNAAHPRVVAVAQWRTCFVGFKAGKPASADACTSAGLTFAVSGDQLGRARTLAVKAAIAAAGLGASASVPARQRLTSAAALATEAYLIAEKEHSQIDQAGALQNRANIWRQLVTYEHHEADRKADADEASAIALFREIGHWRAVAEIQNNQALLMMDDYKHGAALELFETARKGFEESGARSEVGVARANIGKAQLMLGQLAGAEHSLISALQIAAEQGQQDYLADALVDLGSVYLAQGKLCAAERCFLGLQCFPPEADKQLTDVGQSTRWESSVLQLEGGCPTPVARDEPKTADGAMPSNAGYEPVEDEELRKAQDEDHAARALVIDAVNDLARNRPVAAREKASAAQRAARAGALGSAEDARLEISLLITEARAEGLRGNFATARELLVRAAREATDRELFGSALEVRLGHAYLAQLSGRVAETRTLAQEIYDTAQRRGFRLIEQKAWALMRN